MSMSLIGHDRPHRQSLDALILDAALDRRPEMLRRVYEDVCRRERVIDAALADKPMTEGLAAALPVAHDVIERRGMEDEIGDAMEGDRFE